MGENKTYNNCESYINLFSWLSSNKLSVDLCTELNEQNVTKWVAEIYELNIQVWLDAIKEFSSISSKEDYYVFLTRKRATEVFQSKFYNSDKLDIPEFICLCKEKIQSVKQSNIVGFVNENYQDVFIDCSLFTGIVQKSIEVISPFIAGINDEIIEYLINNRKWYIFKNPSVFEMKFKKNPEWFNKIIVLDKNVFQYFQYIEAMVDFLKPFYRSNNYPQAQDALEQLLRYAIKIEQECEQEEAIYYHHSLLFLCSVCENLKLTLTDDMNKALSSLENKIRQAKSPFSFTQHFEFDSAPYINSANDAQAASQKLRALVMFNADELKSKLWTINNDVNNYRNMLYSCQLTSDYYTNRVQHELKIHNIQANFVIHAYISVNSLVELIDTLKLFLNKSKVFSNLNNESNTLLTLISEIAERFHTSVRVEKGKATRGNDILYSCSILWCALLEQLISLAVYKFSDKYSRIVKTGSITHLMENFKIWGLIEDYYFQNILYFLGSKEGVGMNIRNKLAHGKYECVDTLYSDLMTIIWVSIDLLCTIDVILN